MPQAPPSEPHSDQKPGKNWLLLLRVLLDVGCILALNVARLAIVTGGEHDAPHVREDQVAVAIAEGLCVTLALIATELARRLPDDLREVRVGRIARVVVLLLSHPGVHDGLSALRNGGRRRSARSEVLSSSAHDARVASVFPDAFVGPGLCSIDKVLRPDEVTSAMAVAGAIMGRKNTLAPRIRRAR